jgi:hypothetical protein
MDRQPAELKKANAESQCVIGVNRTTKGGLFICPGMSQQEIETGLYCEKEESPMHPSKILHTGWFIALTVALALCVFPMGASALAEGQAAWIDAISDVTANIVPAESVQAYLGQLQIVRTALRYGDDGSVVTAMNRFMEMLDQRQQGLAAEAADRLLAACVRIIPTKFHDVSRHPAYRDIMDRLNEENGFGSSGG